VFSALDKEARALYLGDDLTQRIANAEGLPNPAISSLLEEDQLAYDIYSAIADFTHQYGYSTVVFEVNDINTRNGAFALLVVGYLIEHFGASNNDVPIVTGWADSDPIKWD
jgi:hypothetical protein